MTASHTDKMPICWFAIQNDANLLTMSLNDNDANLLTMSLNDNGANLQQRFQWLMTESLAGEMQRQWKQTLLLVLLSHTHSVSDNRHYCYSATLTVSVITDITVTQPHSVSVKTDITATQPTQCRWKQTLLLLSHAQCQWKQTLLLLSHAHSVSDNRHYCYSATLSVSENRHYCYSAMLTASVKTDITATQPHSVSVKTDNTVTQPHSQCQWKQTILLLSHAHSVSENRQYCYSAMLTKHAFKLEECLQCCTICSLCSLLYSIVHCADIVKQDTRCANSYTTHSLCK